MKKLFVFSILLVLLSTVIFAQEDYMLTLEAAEPKPIDRGRWSFSGEAQVFSDLFYFTKALGALDSEIGVTNTNDEWGNNIKGSFNLMNSSIGPAPGFWAAIYINSDADYELGSYDLSLQLVMTEYFTRGPDYNTVFTNQQVKLLDALSFIFGDWHIKGSAGIFEGYMGNTGYGGFVPVYDNFSDWCNFKLEYFYVNKMGERQSANEMELWGGGSAFALGANLTDNFRLALGTDFGYGGDLNDNPKTTAWTNPYASANSFNVGVIFSGKEIADIVSFDIFYGIHGSDNNSNERGKYNPLGPGPHDFKEQVGGLYKNVFGLYTGVDVIEGLGVSIGYSGEYTLYEKQGYNKNPSESAPDYHSYDLVSPLWSSVQLHANYTGLDKFDITFNNNISFAIVKSQEASGEHPDKIVLGLADGLLSSNTFKTLADNFSSWKDGEKERWLGYDAALGLSYQVSDEFELCLQLVNLFGKYIYTTEKTSGSRTANNFFAVLNAQYNIGFVTFGAGLSFGLETTVYKAESGIGIMNAANNIFRTGMPLVFKVAF